LAAEAGTDVNERTKHQSATDPIYGKCDSLEGANRYRCVANDLFGWELFNAMIHDFLRYSTKVLSHHMVAPTPDTIGVDEEAWDYGSNVDRTAAVKDVANTTKETLNGIP
jgi:hypothetical protein